MILLLYYVDNMILKRSDLDMYTYHTMLPKQMLSNEEPRSLKVHFLGIEVENTSQQYFFSQMKYALDMMSRSNR